MTLFVRDLPRDVDDRELQQELQDLPQQQKEAQDHRLKVELAEKQLQESERLAEVAREAAERARQAAQDAQDKVSKANDALLTARQSQAQARLKGRKVQTALIMRKGDTCSAFVRFETREDAQRALSEIKDRTVQISGRIISGEMARRNTN